MKFKTVCDSCINHQDTEGVMENHIRAMAEIIAEQAVDNMEQKNTIKYLERVRVALEADKGKLNIRVSEQSKLITAGKLELKSAIDVHKTQDNKIGRLLEDKAEQGKSYDELRDKLVDMSNKVHNSTVASELACNSAFGPPTHTQLLAGIDNAVKEFDEIKAKKKEPCYNQLCGKLEDAVSEYNKERLEKRKLLDLLRSQRKVGATSAMHILNHFSEYVKKKGKK